MKENRKTAVITGGNKGIGEVIAGIFLAAGYKVVVGARSRVKSSYLSDKNVLFQKTDVRRQQDHKTLVKKALDWSGRLDVYINCAGFSGWSPVEEVSEGFLSNMIDTNLKGVIWGCSAALAGLKKGGCIINISSLAGKRGSANNSVYCASKFGVNGVTQSLSKELGPRGIRVNAVCPVYIKTEGLMKALEYKKSPAGGKDVEIYLKDFAENNSALGKLPAAEDVAELCLFLASDKAGSITGQCINVDCGVLPQ